MTATFYRALSDVSAGEPLTGDRWAVIDLTRPGLRRRCPHCGIAKGVGKGFDGGGPCQDCQSDKTRYGLKPARQRSDGKWMRGESMNAKGVIVNYDLPGGSGGRQREVRQYEGVTVYDHDGTTVLRRPLAGAPAHDPSRAYARGDVVVKVAS